MLYFFFSSRRRHTRWNCDWSSDVCSSDLEPRCGFSDVAGRDPRSEHVGGQAANLQRAGSAEVEGEFRCRMSAGQSKSAEGFVIAEAVTALPDNDPNNGSRKRSRCGG